MEEQRVNVDRMVCRCRLEFIGLLFVNMFQDIVRIVYVDDDTQYLKAETEKAEGGGQDGKSGIRVMGISPDGQHLAAGDRSGNLR